jgi:hypothetical protein
LRLAAKKRFVGRTPKEFEELDSGQAQSLDHVKVFTSMFTEGVAKDP